MKIQWDRSMSTGVSEIDGQHQALFNQLNQLDDLLDCPTCKIEVDRILDLLEYLEGFARQHFSDEERQMEVHHCDMAEMNSKEHREFLAMLHDFQREFREVGANERLATDIRNGLTSWWKDHILKIDSKLAAAVHDCPNCTMNY